MNTKLKVKLDHINSGFCQAYYKVIDGKYEDILICDINHGLKDAQPYWHTTTDYPEPEHPIDLTKFKVEIIS